MPRIVPSLDTAPRDSLRHLLSAALVIAALYVGAEIFVPTALAILLSFVLAPGVRMLRRWHLGRTLPVLLMTALAFLVISALGFLLAIQLRGLADGMPQYQTTVLDKIETLRGFLAGDGLSRFSDFVSRLGEHLYASRGGAPAPLGTGPSPMPVVIAQPAEMPLETLARYLMPALHPLAVAGLVAIYAVFILLSRDDLRNRAIRLFGAGDLHRSTAAIDDAARRLSRYLLSQLAVNTLAGLVIGLGLAAIGVPSPILWGVFFGALRFVPYVGPPLAALAPLALAAAVAPGWSTAIWTAVLFVAVESAVGQVVEPLLYGHNTGLSPLAVVVAATFWTVLWGPVGLVLSTPITVCLVVLGRHVEPLGFLAVMLGDRPALAPQEVFYQRMLADDPVEASDQAERLLKETSLAAYYDEVLLPGLLLAQDDVAQGRLDVERQARIAASAAEVVENLSDHGDAAALPAAAPLARAAPLPEAWARPNAVLCLGGRGPLDDAVAAALAQLLGRTGFGTALASHDMLGKAKIGALAVDEARLVVLSCLDGSSDAYLRFALRRLRRRRPDVPLLVGAWWRRAGNGAGDAPAAATGDTGGEAAGGRDAVPSLAEAVVHALRLAASGEVADTPAPVRDRDAAVSRP